MKNEIESAVIWKVIEKLNSALEYKPMSTKDPRPVTPADVVCSRVEDAIKMLESAQAKEPDVSDIDVGELRLMVDPSVPQEMILFPDEATREWFNKIVQAAKEAVGGDAEVLEALDWANEETVLHLKYMDSDENPAFFKQHARALRALKHLIRAATQPRVDVREWQPIDTAPRDGTHVQFWMNGEAWFGKWDVLFWKVFGSRDQFEQPTHWMPLPAEPAADDGRG